MSDVDKTAGHLRVLIEKVRIHEQNPDSTKDKVSLQVAADEAEAYLNELAE
jgi:hypothetical protein